MDILRTSLRKGIGFLLILLHCGGFLHAEADAIPKSPKQRICLNMIIKNESHVIERCLKSAKPLIDYWVIVDTGSTDGTQKIVQECMRGIPGELHERPWKNFSHNRNEAMDLAKGKGDYLLFIDADEEFIYEPGFRFPHFDQNCYLITTHYGGMKYGRTLVVKADAGFKWDGVIHEALCGPGPICGQPIAGIYNLTKPEGARSQDPKKFEKDIAVLEEALQENPNHTRYTFYLAQSYRDDEQYQKAVEVYKRRVAMGGWDQEIFFSLYQIALLEDGLGVPSEQIINNYYRAFQSCPERGEPLYYLAKYYRLKGNYEAAYSISKLGMLSCPCPVGELFVETWIYDYGLMLENSIAAYWLGKFWESKALSMHMLKKPDLPENVRTCIERNCAFAEQKIWEAVR